MNLNAEFAAAREAGEQHERKLASAYEKAIRAAGRMAATRFSERAALLAAASWHPPEVSDVMAFATNADRVRAQQRIMLEAIGGRAGEIPGVSFDALQAPSQRLLDKLGARAVTHSSDVREAVASAIAKGWASGYSVPQTAALIRQSVNSLAPARATALARTDLISLSNGTNHEAVGMLNEAAAEAGETPPIGSKTWLSSQDGRVRPTHQDADGQEVPIDQPYDVGGASLMYPGDPDGPDEEVINCRCTELYSDTAVGLEPGDGPEFFPTEGDWTANPAAEYAAQSVAGQLAARFDTELSSLLLRESEEFGQLAGKSRYTIYLSPRYLDDAFMDDWIETFAKPYTVQRKREDVIVHEFGHILDGQMLAKYPKLYEEWEEHLFADVPVVGPGVKPGTVSRRIDNGLNGPSVYGAENRYEWFAEAFTDWYLNGSSASHPSSQLIGRLVSQMQREDFVASSSPEPLYANGVSEREASMATATATRWVSDIAFEGLSTGDGRFMALDSLRWREPPLTLMAMIETPEFGGHSGAQVAGRMDDFSKDAKLNMDGDPLPSGVVAVRSTGEFDTEGDRGGETARMVENETMRGVSVDLAVLEFGFRDPETGEITAADDATDEDWERAFMGELEFAVLDGEVMAATVCPTPAFADARIAILASAVLRPNVWRASAEYAAALGVQEGQMMTTLTASVSLFSEEGALTASVAPLAPPLAWFERPEASEPTPLTVTDDGAIFGHIALWDTCHTGFLNGEWSQCVRAPQSPSNYAHFHVGELQTAEGDLLPIGKLTYDTGHASLSKSSLAARCHYDETGSVGAFVRAKDGQFGIWVCGALRSDLSPEGLRDIRANPPSGDWRSFDHRLDLIAALSVPVPGLPVPRSQLALSASAAGELEVTALILTGLIASAEPENVQETYEHQGYEGAALAAIIDGGEDALAALIEGEAA